MNKPKIGTVLKQLRKISGYSTHEVVSQLKLHNIYIAEKTLYGYENNKNTPNIYTFFALCQIYNWEYPLSLLKISNADQNELILLNKYRNLDENGKVIIETLLDLEVKRSLGVKISKK